MITIPIIVYILAVLLAVAFGYGLGWCKFHNAGTGWHYSAFLTGSHKYGEPTPKSDIDIVVLMSAEEIKAVQNAVRPRGRLDVGNPGGHYPVGSTSLKSTKFNLIACDNMKRYRSWRGGTTKLASMAPVPRPTAVRVFQENFANE